MTGSSPAVARARRLISAALSEAKEQLKQTYPSLEMEVFDWDVAGAGGERSDVMLGLDVHLPPDSMADAAGVAMLVIIVDIHGTPLLEYVGISWSPPLNVDEYVACSEGGRLTELRVDQVVGWVAELLPRLSAVVSNAVGRSRG